MSTSTQVQLVRHPDGWPVADDFRVVDVDLPELADGEVRVANDYVSVDPYMRGRMAGVRTYVEPFALGETMTGGAVGRVLASRSDDVPEGALVLHDQGWRDVAQGPARRFRVLPEAARDLDLPTSVHLGVLGMTGFTAYVGLVHVAAMKAGDVVFVSGAAGAVGSTVGQVARALGAARVIGSAGSPAKVERLLADHGYDAAFDYKAGPVAGQLREAAPDGVDVYFDNVGGDHLEAAIGSMNDFGRAALCGAISGYNATEAAPGPRNLALAVGRRLTLRGFIVSDHSEVHPEFLERMSAWVAAGEVRHDETVVDGVENAPAAFIGMLGGDNTGKMVVRTR